MTEYTDYFEELKTLPLFDITDNAKSVLRERYVLKDLDGEPRETPEQMLWRVAFCVAERGLDWKEKMPSLLKTARTFYKMMCRLDFIPNSPTFTGAKTRLGQLAACFVLPIGDSLGDGDDAILRMQMEAGLIQQTGGGIGFSFGDLRPNGARVASSGGKSTGPIGFMTMLDATFEQIAQGGVRRGANMAVLPVHHPDIMKFIECKDGENMLTNFNISVGITDAFMHAVDSDEMFDLVGPHTEKITPVRALDIWRKICKHALQNGEPGVLFLDTANAQNPVPHLYELKSTNPCVTGDTVIETGHGDSFCVAELVGAQFTALQPDGSLARSTPEGFFCTGMKPVFELELVNEITLRLTANHRVLVSRKGDDLFVEAKDILPSDDVQFFVPHIKQVFRSNMKSLTPVGEEYVYDCTIPGAQRFSANNIIVHNCGEQWLGPYENCCLGSVNLGNFSKSGSVDWEDLKQCVHTAVEFLDDVVDANKYVKHVPQLKEAAMRCRRIGLGIMGLADMMYDMGISYGSIEGQTFAACVMEFVYYHCMHKSADLAATRGAFPAIAGSIYDRNNLVWSIPKTHLEYPKGCWKRPVIKWKTVVTKLKKSGIRNAAVTTVAPTGTIATISGCEGYGCEPVFALAYVRNVNTSDGVKKLTYVSQRFTDRLNAVCLYMEDGAKERIIAEVLASGTCQHIEELPLEIRQIFRVSSDITGEEHVMMQAALQTFVDNSISKTCNFPAGTTVEEISNAYKLAWTHKCKGVTVYVTGSRQKVVLETHNEISRKLELDEGSGSGSGDVPTVVATAKEAETEAPLVSSPRDVPPSLNASFPGKRRSRPMILSGETYMIPTPVGKSYITVNSRENGSPFEVFVATGKAGTDIMAVSEALGRLISYILRMRSDVGQVERLRGIAGQLDKIGGRAVLGRGPKRVTSLADGIASALNIYLNRNHPSSSNASEDAFAFLPVMEDILSAVEEGEEDGASHVAEKRDHLLGDICGVCGQAALVNEEGCRKCYSCGYSEC